MLENYAAAGVGANDDDDTHNISRWRIDFRQLSKLYVSGGGIMANLPVKKDDGVTTVYIKATGTGTIGDPFILERASTAIDGADLTQGITTGAAVVTDVAGTIQQYLRGLVKLVAAKIATLDGGPSWTPVRTFTTSADMTTAAEITAAPTGGQKIVADDILISALVAMEFDIEMETSANVLASVFLPANGTAQITLRDFLKGDAADKKLFGHASAAGNVRITACYHSEA